MDSVVEVTNILNKNRLTNSRESKDDNIKLAVKKLNFYYGSQQVLFENCIDIREKKITAIIGPSGCGKSTHIRTYNRIFELYHNQRAEGKIMMDGTDLLSQSVNTTALRQRVGMIFQKPSPFPMSVFDNIAYGLRINTNITGSELSGRVEVILKKAALWDEVKDKLWKSGAELSGGQQQRLCIGRAIAIEPDVLLMDEPCSAIDPVATTKIEELMLDLKSHYTIVIVTHNMQQAARVSDYTAFFYQGHIVEFDKTKKLFTNPRHQQTEDYITGRFG